MRAVIATGVFGTIVIALLTEIMNVVMTFSALQHVASYNAWMAM